MIKKILRILLSVVLFIFVLASGLYLYTKAYLQEQIQTPQLLFIPQGSTKNALAKLKKDGIDLHWFDFYLLKLYGYPQAGWINLGDENLTRELFFEKLTHAKAALQKVTLIPGETNVIFMQNVSQQLDLNFSKLMQVYTQCAPYDDGVILADTYHVPYGIDEEALVHYLVDVSLSKQSRIAAKYNSQFDRKQWFTKTVTIASIIQKEAANQKEMPIVSAVIHNRLKKGMKLQMDGALNYGKYSHIKVTAKRIREDNSSYNTYKFAGLPPSPLCAVSEAAIQAALKPASVNFLYFVKGKKGTHIFTKTYKEHLKHIK